MIMNKSILLLAVLTMPLLVQIANAQQSNPKATILDTKTLTIKNPKWIDEDIS
jgi:ABC-type transporter MlaC component